MTDAEGRIIFYNEAAAALWGCRPEVGESKFSGSYKLYWPDGTPLPHDECPMAIALRRKRPIRGMEAIAERPDGTRVPFIPYPTPLFDATGRLTGAINMLVDIGDHKRAAEQALVERNILLALAGRAARVGTFAYDTDKEILQISEDYAAIHGLPEGTTKIVRSEWLAGVHPHDIERVELPRSTAFREQRNEYSAEFRIIRPGGEIRWVEIRCFITYDANRRPKRVVGVSTDVTDRKQAELALGERNTLLALAGKVALVGSYAYDVDADEMQVSEGYAAIHGLPDATAETTGSAWRWRVHPEDVGRVERLRSRALRDRACEHTLEYRIVLPDRGVRWIESRSFISYNSDGSAQRVIGINIDVTDRKQTEARLSDALAAGQVVAFEWDTVTGRSQRSDNADRVIGFVGDGRFLKQVHPDDRDYFNTLIRSISPDNPSYLSTFRFVRSDGRQVWLEETGKGEFGRAGRLLRIKGLTRDITERKQAELALAERNTQLALAGKAGLVATFAYDVKTERVQISEGYAAIYGFPEGTTEIARSQWRALVLPDDLERLESLRNQAFADRQREYGLEYRIFLPDRGVRWIETRSFVSYDAEGRPQRVVGVNIDVTERRQMEQILTDRNRQLQLAGKAALVGSFALDIDAAQEDFSSQRMQFSPGFAAIYGLPEETEEISVGHWRSLVHPDDLPQFVEHRQQLFAERRGEHHAEFRIVRPFGTIRWIEARSFIAYDQAGHAKRLVGVNIDITERKRAEEARKILNAELDHRVKNALATVTAVISHTQQGSRSVADFAAALEGRIRSMAATHELLSSRHWQELSLIELIRRELAPYAASKNTEISGPTVLLKPEAGQALAMVLHELATNAAKYGALSTHKGRVIIRWDRPLNGRPLSSLVLKWREIGGPRVDAPGKSSYGTSTIHDLIPYEFGGTVDLVFAPEGVRWRIEITGDMLHGVGA